MARLGLSLLSFRFEIAKYPAMRRAIRSAVLIGCLVWSLVGLGRARSAPPDISAADALFQAGKFSDAETIYSQIANTDAKNYPSRLKLANIALLANRLDAAIEWSRKALAIKADEADAKIILGEALYREGKFAEAGAELLLDTEFAKSLGVKTMGSNPGTFSGGEQAPVGDGRANSVTLGAWTLKNVPVQIMPLRPMSAGFGIAQLDGCVGTNVLYQFLATIDYPAGELVLRRKTPANVEALNAALKTSATGKPAAILPIWMAGDHFMVTGGRVGALPPALFFVDSGLAGAGVKLAESTIKAAGISLDKNLASTGQGGGGNLVTVPYTVKKFSLGTVSAENVPGVYDGPFPFENSWGFHVDGMVGNDFLHSHAVSLDFTGMRLILQ
jgi:Aspartyl protease